MAPGVEWRRVGRNRCVGAGLLGRDRRRVERRIEVIAFRSACIHGRVPPSIRGVRMRLAAACPGSSTHNE